MHVCQEQYSRPVQDKDIHDRIQRVPNALPGPRQWRIKEEEAREGLCRPTKEGFQGSLEYKRALNESPVSESPKNTPYLSKCHMERLKEGFREPERS
jgi:hypothetical protein